MHQVFVGLGSNLNREHNLQQAIRELHARFTNVTVSPIYQTQAVGFDGEDFYNLVVAFETTDDVETLVAALHEIEDQLGRDRTLPKFSSRSIDLDLLLFDDLVLNRDGVQVPRNEILVNAFVLRPLFDLVPDKMHPEAKRSYAELWQEMALTTGRIDRVALDGL